MSRFIVFDVETPNRFNNRMSSIGVTAVEDGRVADRFFTLVNPETYFDYFNTRLTGISEETVADAPTFPEAWDKLEPLLTSGIPVAHNAVFDLSVLKKCLNGYGIFWKDSVRYLCTVQMGRRLLPEMSHSLDAMCVYYGIALDHHRADSDSEACAQILLHYLDSGADVSRFIRTYRLTEQNT
ncbi:MAG: 3'-5' exonuclease [Oscillospiraceae bacterium]|nr:3'-5' exonuclease [Oscillospiraceae bacterium]